MNLPIYSSSPHSSVNGVCPSLSSIDYCLATGIDCATLDKVFHGSTQIITITEVVVEDPLFRIDPVSSLDLNDFHGDHPLSKTKSPEPLGPGACWYALRGDLYGRPLINF